MNYYYLMAQLPVLIYEQKPPMSSDVFRKLAEDLLNEKDAALMRYLSIEPDYTEDSESTSMETIETAAPTHCNFVNGWREWERALRLNLAKNRAHNLKRENEIRFEPPVVPVEALVTASKAISEELSPLEAEFLIDKARWYTVCSLVGHNYFSRENVFAYYLKLVLMERRMSFDTENGFSEYKSLYASILESAHTSLGEPK